MSQTRLDDRSCTNVFHPDKPCVGCFINLIEALHVLLRCALVNASVHMYFTFTLAFLSNLSLARELCLTFCVSLPIPPCVIHLGAPSGESSSCCGGFSGFGRHFLTHPRIWTTMDTMARWRQRGETTLTQPRGLEPICLQAAKDKDTRSENDAGASWRAVEVVGRRDSPSPSSDSLPPDGRRRLPAACVSFLEFSNKALQSPYLNKGYCRGCTATLHSRAAFLASSSSTEALCNSFH